MTTEKQIQANRRNAQRSTGPKTEEGKQAVRLNALKHGLLSSDVVLTDCAAPEDPEKYTSLVEGLIDELQPEGEIEFMLVHTMAQAAWRLRRVPRAETGYLREALGATPEVPNEGPTAWVRARLADLAGGPSILDINPFGNEREETEKFRETQRQRLRDSADGLRYLLQRLDEFRVQAEAGAIPKEEMVNALLLFGRGFTEELTEKATKKDRAGFLATLSTERAHLEALLEGVEARETRTRALRGATGVIPSMEQMDKLHRYETMYERQLYRALKEYERIHDRRLHHEMTEADADGGKEDAELIEDKAR